MPMMTVRSTIQVRYYIFVPTRTGQTDNYNLSVGVSATWSKPLDKDLQELCKNAAEIQMAAVEQTLPINALTLK